jgi:hypothetical protein
MNEQFKPTHFIGRDGFYWWIGQIEDVNPPKNYDNQVKVRIIGQHLKDCKKVETIDLPWSIVMMPATAPRREGNSDYQTSKYKVGDWVIGFFMDGAEGQHPIVIGSLGQQHLATTNINNPIPETSPCLQFTTPLNQDTNPFTTFPSINQQFIQYNGLNFNGKTEDLPKFDLRGAVNASTETASPALIGTKCCNSDTNPGGQHFCVAISDAKCNNSSNDQIKIQQILTDLFINIANNGGSLGTNITSKYTGKLYDYVYIAQGYINKLNTLISSSLARVKGELYALIKQGTNEILDFLLTQQVIDPIATGIAIALWHPPLPYPQPIYKRVGRMSPLIQWINQQLEQVGCKMTDLDKKLKDFLTNLIFGYINQSFSAATCMIDNIVQDIIKEISSFFNGIISDVLGPLQQLLTIIENPLNILGQALQQIFNLLDVTCGSPGAKCAAPEQTQHCTGPCGTTQANKNFLDNLIASVEKGNLTSPSDSCSDMNNVAPIADTIVSIIGGAPDSTAYTDTTTNIVAPTISDPFNILLPNLTPIDINPIVSPSNIFLLNLNYKGISKLSITNYATTSSFVVFSTVL